MAQFTRVINTSGATTILATKPCRGYTVRESLLEADGSTSNTPQGFKVQDKTFPNQPTVERPAPSQTGGVYNQPFPEFHVGVDEDASFHGPHGQILANGPNVVVGIGVTAALPLCVVTSATMTETSIEVTEYV